MTISSSDMKLSGVIILMFNNFCVFSQIPHEVVYVMGCFVNGATEIQFEFDGEEVLYVDFSKNVSVIYTVPTFIDPDPSQLLVGLDIHKDALDNKELCLQLTALATIIEKHTPERDPPEIVLFTSKEVQLGAENRLICFVNHFYPPSINISWNKNGHPLSEGMSLSRYYPNNNGTFHQFSTLTFTPSEGDIYSCTVEHEALEMPKTQIWEPDFIHQSLGPDIFCGISLTVALLGVAVGVFFIVKAQHGQ